MPVRDDIRESVEAMFYSPNYCDLYMHVNQVREMLRLDKMLQDDIIEENAWVIQQFRKYVGSHQAPVLKNDDYYKMLLEVEDMIERSEETNKAARELLYMYLRDEWLNQLHTAVEAAYRAAQHIDDEEDYDA